MARKCGYCREPGHTRTTCPTANAPQPETGTAPETESEQTTAADPEPSADPEPCAHPDGFAFRDGKSCCAYCGEPDTAAAKLERYRSRHHAPGCDCTLCVPITVNPQVQDPTPPRLPRTTAGFDSECGTCDGSIWVGDEIVQIDGEWVCARHEDENEHGEPAPVSVPAPTVPVMDTQTAPEPEPDPFSDPTSRPGQAFTALLAKEVGNPGTVLNSTVPPIEFSDPTPVKPKREQTNRRGYLAKDPTTGKFRRYQNGNVKPFTRVSTFVKAGSDRTALTDWNMRNVLLGAVHFPQIAAQAKILHPDPNGPLPEDKDTKQALDRIVDRVAEQVGSKRAANRGTEVHDSIEKVAKGRATLDEIPADHVPWVKAYLAALDAAGLEIMPDMVEHTIFVPQFGGVMGRFDQAVREIATGKVKMADVKTGELDYAWNEIQGQLALYVCGYAQHGTYVWDESDPEKDYWVPPKYTLDADEGIVFHLPVKHGDAEHGGPRCELKRVDLRAGWEHVKLCARNREAASSRPKPQPYVPATVPAPEPAYCGMCMYGSDIGVPGYDDKGPAYVNPSCPTHGSPATVPDPTWEPGTEDGSGPDGLMYAPPRVPVPAKSWRREFEWAQSREHMAALYEQAAEAGVDPDELGVLVSIGSMRLAALANGAPLYPYTTPEPPF